MGMTDAQVKQVIDALLNSTFLDDWYLYLILFLVSLLGGFAGSFIRSYGSEKSKYAAIETSLNTIKKQVKITTETSEGIKHALEIDNWRKKEIEKNKRKKLEEYYSLICLIEENQHTEMTNHYFEKTSPYDSQVLNKATLIQSLYFPEIKGTHLDLIAAVGNYRHWMNRGLFLMAEAINKGQLHQSPSTEHMELRPPLEHAMVTCVQASLDCAREVAKDLNQ